MKILLIIPLLLLTVVSNAKSPRTSWNCNGEKVQVRYGITEDGGRALSIVPQQYDSSIKPFTVWITDDSSQESLKKIGNGKSVSIGVNGELDIVLNIKEKTFSMRKNTYTEIVTESNLDCR